MCCFCALKKLSVTLLEAVQTPSDACAVRPIAMKSLQVGCFIFLGTFLAESLATCSPPNTGSSLILWMCTPTHASVRKFYQRYLVIASITHSQLRHSWGMKPSQIHTDNGELPALSFCFTEDKILDDSWCQALSCYSKVCRTQSSSRFSGPRRWQKGGWRLPPPNPFLMSLTISFIRTRHLWFYDILLFRKPVINLWLDIPHQFFEEQYWRMVNIYIKVKTYRDFFKWKHHLL